MAVVIAKLPNGEVAVFGPFNNGAEASRWGMDKFKGTKQDWFWEAVFSPNTAIEAINRLGE